MSLKHTLRTQLQKQPIILQNEVDDLNNVLSHFLSSQNGIWAGYRALQDEPNIDPAIAKAKHLRWVFPKVRGQELEFLHAEKFDVGAFKILEPADEGSKAVSTSEIEGALVPAMAFDCQGVRLGRGLGYYDRALKNKKLKKVGIALNHQIFSVLPVEAHDVKMDAVVTPVGVIQMVERMEG